MIDPVLIPDVPFAIAFSGGGDSTALVHRLKDREPLILIVDHALRAESGREAKTALDFARGLGLRAEILKWSHGPIRSGLQEKARQARYQLLGEACRKSNISYLLTGHTQDDQAETLLMRYDRHTDWRGAAGMRESVYAPLWPELAGVTVIRPLLSVTRSELRSYNQTFGLHWIDEPGNENTNFARIRARHYLSSRPELRRVLLKTAQELRRGLNRERDLFRTFADLHLTVDPWGLIHLDRTPPPALLGELCRIAGGTGSPVDRDSARRLLDNMHRSGFGGETLANALILPNAAGFVIGPDPVTYKGRQNRPAIEPQPLGPAEFIWDGRYRIRSMHADLTVRILGEDRSILSQGTRAALRQIPPVFRGSLPYIVDRNSDIVAIPGEIKGHPGIEINTLISERLNALWDM